MARYLKLKLRQNVWLYTSAGRLEPGSEFTVSYADAASFLKGKGRRWHEIIEDFESEEPPDGMVSIERLDEEPG